MEDLGLPQVVVTEPAYAFAKLVHAFFMERYRSRGISDHIHKGREVEIGEEPSIWPFVTLGDRVKIGNRVTLFPAVFVGDDCEIGDDCLIYPNVTIRERTKIGRRVIIHSGTVIGGDGFGYVPHEGKPHKIPQIGRVVIEDDVEIGANSAVDRATFGETVVRRGTKVDNLVQIAHNVVIGEDSIIVAQAGIAGSTKVGNHVTIAGQAGISDHLSIGDNAVIGAQSGINRNVPANQTVIGTPAMPHEIAVKSLALFPQLPGLRQQVRELEARVRKLEARLASKKKAKR